MLTQLIIQLSPLKIFLFGLLFFWASWMATKKILLLAVLGLSAGETTWDSLHGQVETISTNPYVLNLASAAGIQIHDGSVLSPLVANVLLALAMLSLVQAMKVYTRAKRAEMEIQLNILEIQGGSKLKNRLHNRR